ncbi:MAG: hypothetical protein IH916_06755 [Acidobacteria bacterium]|nr:hypothetical protein [Acidobacteriota bacterium]
MTLCGFGVPVALGQESPALDTKSAVVEGQIAPRLQNLGDYKHPVTTSSPRAQLFFNQGLTLTFGFNHREAGRSFREVARLDPDCAMAYWGQALVLGPNINMPMPPDAEAQAYELIQKAVALKAKVSERERAYIDALAKRYSNEEKPDRKALDRAYAEAARQLSERYPDDLDAATLYAEALMDLRPWNYWTKDGRPYPGTLKIVSVLESVLERNPNHPLGIHLYIHAVEAVKPELAEAGADRLGKLAPGAGHLVHMPSHIYRRLGRYADASEANVQAIAADEDYITQCRAQGIYPLGYYPHNIHFLWDAASMEGRSEVAIDAARKVASKLSAEKLRELPMLNSFAVVPLFAYTRFGKWEEILQEPRPADDLLFLAGIWHYARGLAFTATGRLGAAATELESLDKIAADKSLQDLALFSPNPGAPIIKIAAEVLAGRLAAKRGETEKAIAHLHRAVLLEDALVYTEPADWHYPVRQSLGAVLLQAGRAAEAETVYWEDLRRNPENGWSLFGLMKSLEAQGKTEQAEEIEQRFRKAWDRANVTLTASRF